jgi:hypothetical protein
MTRTPSDPPGDSIGRPVDELQRLETETSPQFMQRLHRKIERRVLARDLSVMTWELPKLIFSELLFVCAQWVHSDQDRGDHS